MKDIQKEPMCVMRVQDERGSHIEPACDQAWPQIKKLRWQAAVVSGDTGLKIMVHEFPTNYCISIGSTSTGISGYRETSIHLSGISTGAEQYARQIAPSIAAQAKAEALQEAAVAWRDMQCTDDHLLAQWLRSRAATVLSEPTPGAAKFTGPSYDAHPGHDHEDCCK